MLAFVRDGDTVVVRSMDRLARNLEPPGPSIGIARAQAAAHALGIQHLLDRRPDALRGGTAVALAGGGAGCPGPVLPLAMRRDHT